MEFLQNTNNWVKGEILEASIIAVFGIIVLLSGVALGKFGTTPNARALLLPLLVVGILLLSFGISLYFSNQKRLSEYKEQFEENTIEFVQQEKKRVEDFQYMYIISKVIATIAFVLAFFAFWFTKSSTSKLSLMLTSKKRRTTPFKFRPKISTITNFSMCSAISAL